MKAEHRKELQTNVLADRLGRLAQRVKTPPRRSTLLWVVLALIVVVGLIVFNQTRKAKALQYSEQWYKLEDGHKRYIEELFEKNPDENVGKAARFQVAYIAFWTKGVKFLGGDSKLAYRNINAAKIIYQSLAEECKDDPLWEPEALYHLALIEETLAAYDRAHLKKARDLYNNLANHPEHQNSVYAQMAQERAKLLDPDSREGKYNDIARLYEDLQKRLKIQPPDPTEKKLTNRE